MLWGFTQHTEKACPSGQAFIFWRAKSVLSLSPFVN